jgi:hypothetical protein
MQEQETIQGLLNRFHLIPHGHFHEADFLSLAKPASTSFVTAAGAAYAGSGWKHGFHAGSLNPATGEVALHFFTWSHRDDGFWHPDPGAVKGAPSGVATLAFAKPITAPVARVGARVAAEGLAARLRSAAATVYGQVKFIRFAVARRPKS